MRRAQGCKKVGEERSPKMDPEKGGEGGRVVGWLGQTNIFHFYFRFQPQCLG